MRILKTLDLVIACMVVLFTIGITLSHTHAQVPEGLVLYYDFETKGQIADLSGQKNNPIINGNPEWIDSLEGMGNAIVFNTVGDFLTVPDADSLKPEEAITVACWLNWDGQKAECEVMGQFQWQVGGWLFRMTQAELYLWMYDKDAGSHQYHVQHPLAGEWIHIVVTFDGEIQRGYVNGILSPSGDVAWEGPIKYVNTSVKIGAYAGNLTFTGAIDEIAIYNRALTEEEIQFVMENGHSDFVESVKPNEKLSTLWGSIKVQ